jgi:hypothetical protein
VDPRRVVDILLVVVRVNVLARAAVRVVIVTAAARADVIKSVKRSVKLLK